MKAPAVVDKREEPQETKKEEPAPTTDENNAAAAGNKSEFTITLRKTPENNRLGLTVDIANSVCMVVDKVNGGLLAAWNQTHTDLEVKPGDQIITVNGQSGDAVELTQVCKENDVL